MANKKSNHPKNNAEIEHKIDVSDDLDLATQDTTPNEHVETNAEDKTETMQQNEEKITPSEQKPIVHETVVVKKTGSALGLLALLIALGLGGAGYYFGQLQVEEIQQKLTALENQLILVQRKISWRN